MIYLQIGKKKVQACVKHLQAQPKLVSNIPEYLPAGLSGDFS